MEDNRVKAVYYSTLVLDIREWLVMGTPTRVKVEPFSIYLQAQSTFLVLHSYAPGRFVPIMLQPPFR